MYISFHVKYFFLTDIRKNNQISNFMRIRPAGAELLHVDLQT